MSKSERKSKMIDGAPLAGEAYRPNPNRCCMCGQKRGLVQEPRRTGESGTTQLWSFCKPCKRLHDKVCNFEVTYPTFSRELDMDLRGVAEGVCLPRLRIG